MSERIESVYSSEQLTVLEGLDPVRKRPSMYIGNTDLRGLHHLFVEVVDNSIDEAMAGHCTQIDARWHADNSLSVRDDGRGIPVDIHKGTGLPGVTLCMTKLHAGGKFEGKNYKFSGGLHGVGVSCVNALAEWLEVEVRQHGQVHFQRFERGVPKTDLIVIGKCKAGETGTTVRWSADHEIFPKVEYHEEILVGRLRDLSYLTPGLRITYTNENTGESQVFQHEGGISAFVEHMNRAKDALHKVIYFRRRREEEEVEVDVAFQYNDGYQENVLSFANNIKTPEGGFHFSGFRMGLTRVLNHYARKNGLLKEKDPNFTGDDVLEGLCAVISVRLRNPQFEGQTKGRLGNPEIQGIVNSCVGDGLTEFLEQHPQAAQRIIGKAATAAKAREAARKAADAIKRASALEGGGLPGKLKDCIEKDPMKCELFLVEGDSAGGSAQIGRDRRYQAILALRGKPLCVEKARLDRALDNEEIKSLITAVGVGIAPYANALGAATTNGNANGNGTGNGNGAVAVDGDGAAVELEEEEVEPKSTLDLGKLRYNRIIIMTDADVDGAHIRTLLLNFFYRYMQALVEAGHIYLAKPPLYKISAGKERLYAWSEQDLEEKKKQIRGRNPFVQRFKGLGEMDADELAVTTMDVNNRSLMQVTVDDAVTADQIFSVLLGEKVEPRRQFIEAHAKDIKDLDI
jgi:DNA gyrase subunit B